MELAAFTAAYILSFFIAGSGMYFLSGAVTAAAGIAMALFYYRKYGRLTCPAVIFSLSWSVGVGISCMKLSKLQTEWETVSWICFFLTYAVFIACYRAAEGKLKPACAVSGGRTGIPEDTAVQNMIRGRILASMDIIAAVSLASLAAEGFMLGYIPLFTVDTPHAYSYFHVSGLHYFTVSCVLLPSLAVIWGLSLSAGDESIRPGVKDTPVSRKELVNVSLCTAVGIIVPILLVSRYQLFFGIMLAASVYLVMKGGRPGRRIQLCSGTVLLTGCAGAVLAALYVFITVQRAHSIEYLNGIFEMKNEHMPIFISQPYIYIANNFDNFNCLVRELPAHTHGLRMLFPVIALSGLKFLKPELAAFPIYVTKEELTTVTLIYDAYYDFGVIGVAAFAALLGACSAWLEHKAADCLTVSLPAAAEQSGPVGSDTKRRIAAKLFFTLVYAQLCVYLTLAFFTTWFSNPTTWFLFAASLAVSLFCGFRSV